MYIAELKGKLSLFDERKEDVLTSNVFSFFKYSTRKIFLKKYLWRLGFKVTDDEADSAQFLFWHHYEENTEPDLIIIVGNHYLLFEAKYFSDFGEETDTKRAQLIREIEGGILDAKNYEKGFCLIAITADHYYKPWKFDSIPEAYKQSLRWTNWQKITTLLYDALEGGWDLRREDLEFAQDLYSLLDKRNLRNFLGIHNIYRDSPQLARVDPIFFEARTARFRGDFIGFVSNLSVGKKMSRQGTTVFFRRGRVFFETCSTGPKFQVYKSIFWEGNGDDE